MSATQICAAPLSVLIVDDDEPSNRIAGTLLNRWGYNVEVCRNGVDALAAAKDRPPHVVLADIAMPRMDGYEVARQLRQQPELLNTVLIALTGYGDEESIRRSLEAGFDLHVTKPVPPLALHELLDQARLSRAAVRERAAQLVKESKARIAIAKDLLASTAGLRQDAT
ncbi:MAG: response regulator [Planctomycetes bacterium]|nr:response regulator [Planctomycetota bacterium]